MTAAMKTITVEGANIHDITSLYDELNRVFMSGEDWKLGTSLDAFNDLLYGGFGAIEGGEHISLVWNCFAHTAQALGADATREWYKEKLKKPDLFNKEIIGEKLTALERGHGQTYFDIILEIIADHKNIELVPR